MRIKMEIYLKGLKKEINRQINVNDNMKLQSFCEYVVVSMNGNCKHLYQLTINDEYSYLGSGCDIIDEETEEMMANLKISDLELQERDKLLLNYDFRADWEFIIKIKSIKEGYFEKDFEVISGYGQGILENLWNSKLLKECISSDLSEIDKKIYSRIYEGFNQYIDKKFDIFSINTEIDNYIKKYRELVKPKRYIMNISLDGYETEIKRKISVDSNVKLDKFCRCVILSMNGDLSHLYGIKRAKEYVDNEIIEEQDLNYFELKEKQRLKVIYDFGDNWIFHITISKIIEGYGNKRFEVLSGKGYGIIDDCGGIGDLYDIFNKINTDWGEYDINDFNIKQINQVIDKYF